MSEQRFTLIDDGRPVHVSAVYEQGRPEAAERHFVRAGERAPHDFTIRRGSMSMRGIDPMGPEFRRMSQEWAMAGRRYCQPLPGA